ncbi:MAG: phosphotransferase family protein [Actinomycetota bacterium]|nr:phosphotransferase family protein [Actinomycetota bacterium]
MNAVPSPDASPDAVPGIDHAPVERWIAANVPGVVPPLRFSLISGGHSNITYFVDDSAGFRAVVRRPPLGSHGGNAHDMGREFRVIDALNGSAVPVPKALALCTDEAVNGSPFYVMGCVPGQVVDNPGRVESFLPGAAARRRAGEQIVDVMAALHQVDIDAVGLGQSARREGFLDRQLKRLVSVWAQNKTRELPLMEELRTRLIELKPEQRYTGIVHSDYRMGNVMFDADGTLTGVLDWVLWTLGDPLSDLGFMLNNWYEPGDTTPQVWMEVPPTLAGGFLSRDEVLARYAERTGFDVSGIQYYRAFQHWKIAVIAEGVKRRYENAAMASNDVDFEHLSQRVVNMAELANDLLRDLG